MAESKRLRTATRSSSARPRFAAAGRGDGTPLRARRSAVHLRQRRQRHRRRGNRRAVPQPAAGPPPAGAVARRRPCGPHRARQRRRLRAGVLPPDHRPRSTRRHRDRVLDERRLGERAAGPRRGDAARAADDRAVRVRGRCDGELRRRRSLPGGALRQRPSDPGGAGRARARTVVCRAGGVSSRASAARAGS